MLDELSKKLLEQMRKDYSVSNEIYYDFDEDLDDLAEKISSDSESVHAAVRYLEKLGFIEYVRSSESNTVIYFLLSHKGLHQEELERDDPESKMLEELKKMADAAQEQAAAAKEQARLAREDAGAAREDARIARRQSRINIGIAILAVIVALLAWLVPRDAVYQAICAFFQSH